MAVYFAVGAAVMLAVLVALFRPGTAQGMLQTWQRYKEVGFLLIGGVTTYYFLSSGVWYLVLLGAGGVVFVVWAIWFSDAVPDLTGWAR